MGDARDDTPAEDLGGGEAVGDVGGEAAHELLLALEVAVKPRGGVLKGADGDPLEHEAPLGGRRGGVDAADAEVAEVGGELRLGAVRDALGEVELPPVVGGGVGDEGEEGGGGVGRDGEGPVVDEGDGVVAALGESLERVLPPGAPEQAAEGAPLLGPGLALDDVRCGAGAAAADEHLAGLEVEEADKRDDVAEAGAGGAEALEHGDAAHAVERVDEVDGDEHEVGLGGKEGGGGVHDGDAPVLGADADLDGLERLAGGLGVLPEEDAAAEAAEDLADGDRADAAVVLEERDEAAEAEDLADLGVVTGAVDDTREDGRKECLKGGVMEEGVAQPGQISQIARSSTDDDDNNPDGPPPLLPPPPTRAPLPTTGVSSE